MAFAACLVVHFLAASPNRSTSCLFSMMLSSTQEITCLCFSHQSPTPPPLSLSNYVWQWPVCQLLRVSHFLLLAPDSPLLPNFIWSRRRSFELDENATLQKPIANGKTFLFLAHVCVSVCVWGWSNFNGEIPRGSRRLHERPPPPSRPLLMNYLSPQSIDAFSCILHPSWDRWFSFICAVIIVGEEGKSRYDMKAKVQLLPSPSPSTGASRRSISGRSRAVEKVSPSHFDVGARCW